MSRVEKDGLTAVIYSPGYGAGWSSWAEHAERSLLLFDPHIVDLILERDAGLIDLATFSQRVEQIWQLKGYQSYLNNQQLEIAWVPTGSKFRIHEYDGSETVVLHYEDDWYVA